MTPATLKRWLIAGNALVALLLLAAVALPLRETRQLQLDRATDAATNLARTLGQTLHADVTRLDLALQAVVAAGPQLAAERVHSLRPWLPEADVLRLTDARGNEPDSPTAADHSQQAFFIQASQALPGAAAVFAGPWQPVAGGPWVITLARAVRHGDGRLAGVIHGELPVAQLGRRFEGVDVGEQGALALRTTALALLARQTARGPAKDGIGSITVSTALKDMLRSNPRNGAYVAVVPSDGIERANAYQQVGDYPLLVLAGLGTAEFLAAWQQQARQTGSLAALLMLALVAASVLIHRGWARDAVTRAELAAQSHRYRTLLLTANDGIHLLGLDGRLIECNEVFAAMLGRRPEDLVGSHMAEWDAHYDAAQLENWLTGFKPGRKRRSTSRFRHTDGTLIDVEINSAAMAISGRTKVLCSARDITESLRLQASTAQNLARAEASEQFLQAITDNVPLRMAYVDPQVRYRFVNRAHLERFGKTREQIIGRSRFELSNDPQPAVASAAFEAALAGQAQQFEFHEAVGGRDRVIESRLIPDVAPDGRVRGVYTVGNDVTDRYAQQRRIEEALAERETLLREVYHRVKNNLQMVQSLLSLQQRALAEGPAREALAESSQRVRAMALVHEQLYQTRSLAAVDLRGYTQELLKRVGDAGGTHARGIELRCEIAPGVEVMLDQAVPYGLLVTELVLNSLKHAFGEGGGRIRVAIEAVDAAAAAAGQLLIVSDDGQGMAADFTIGAAKRSGSIGLQLAASLTSQLGGELKAIPTPDGRGAAFAAVLTRLVV